MTVADPSDWLLGGERPGRVLTPGSPEEVADVMRRASDAGTALVPLGRRTQPGCEPPTMPFDVLSTERLGGVESYEPADLTVTAAAGIPLQEISEALAEHSQWLPFDPPGVQRRTLGGLVATGASGPLGASFGSARDHVLGVSVVTGDGRLLRLGGRVMKNVAGFDLVRLMVGSRGTLGVIVSATVRVFPRPEVDRTLVVRAARAEELMHLARTVSTAPVVPASAVLMDPGPDSTEAALYVRLAGAAATVEAEEHMVLGDALDRVERMETESGAVDVDGATTGDDVVIRVSVLPASVPLAISHVRSTMREPRITAEILGGKVRVVAGSAPPGPEALKGLRQRIEGLGGSLILEQAPPALVAVVGREGPGRPGGRVAAALRSRFDPAGVLGPWKLTS